MMSAGLTEIFPVVSVVLSVSVIKSATNIEPNFGVRVEADQLGLRGDFLRVGKADLRRYTVIAALGGLTRIVIVFEVKKSPLSYRTVALKPGENH
jgi:hypothetical protein